MAETGLNGRVSSPRSPPCSPNSSAASATASSPSTCSARAPAATTTPDSDVDVVVILDQKLPHPFELTREILEDTYDLLMETGFHIQPWPLEKGSLENPAAHPQARISKAILRDGIRIDG